MATDEDAKSELDELEQLRASPLRVLGVVVPPDLHTRHEKIFREFRPTTAATTLEEVLKCADETLVNLEDLGVFHEVDAEIVQSRSGEAGTCAIKLTTKEMARWGFKLLAHVTMDARVVSQANAKLRNLTGYADHHTVMFQYGGHTRHDMHGKDLAYKLRFARIFGRPLHSQLKLHRSNNDCRFESSYNELVRGINFDLMSSNGCHVGGYELSWLQLTDPSFGSAGGASPEVQAHMGDHVRSALNYTFCFDARERSDTGLLHSGHALRLHGSVAGLSPDESQLQHIRATADMQHVLPLSEGGALVIDTSCGFLMPILGCLKKRKETLISERFHLGGIAYLRGFQYKGLGDRAARRDGEPPSSDSPNPLTSDALGGDIFARVRAAVNFSLPGEALQRMGVHGHVFADTGSIAKLFGKEQTVSDGFSRFWNEWRLSFGAGIRIPFTAQGFFELNYVQTLKKFGKDLAAPGLQFGFAAEPYTPIPPKHL